MNPARARKGVHVRIADDITKTDREFSSNLEMTCMKGNMYKIEDDMRSGNGVHISGYTFHVEDLIELSPRKKPQKFHFDEKELQL